MDNLLWFRKDFVQFRNDFVTSLGSFVQSFDDFVTSLGSFVKSFDESVTSLESSVQSFDDFVISLGSSVKSFDDFVTSLGSSVQSFDDFVKFRNNLVFSFESSLSHWKALFNHLMNCFGSGYTLFFHWEVSQKIPLLPIRINLLSSEKYTRCARLYRLQNRMII